MSELSINPNLPKLTEVSLDISKIQSKQFIWQVPKTQLLAGLIIFEGTYLPGSGGSDDALFIKWRIDEFCELNSPQTIDGIIVDFRNLDYQWGDDLDVHPLRLRRQQKPVRVIVLPERFDIFEGILGNEELRIDIETAITEVNRSIQSSNY